MTKDKRNNLIITATIFIVLIGAGSTFFLIKSNEVPKKLSGHQIVFASDSGRNDQFGIDKFAKLRNYVDYKLTFDSLTNLRILALARQKINSIKDTQDTINGIHIIIADNTPYNFYIKSIDICSEKAPRAFAPNKNDIYAWYLYVPPKDKRGEITSD